MLTVSPGLFGVFIIIIIIIVIIIIIIIIIITIITKILTLRRSDLNEKIILVKLTLLAQAPIKYSSKFQNVKQRVFL